MNTAKNAHLTAITRKNLSKPMRYLSENNLLKGSTLDYGCGKGFDADTLKLDKYDPFYQPELIAGKQYDTITCNYVLNVVTESIEDSVLDAIRGLLKPSGTAYISVRRDFKKDYISKRGTLQRIVRLNLPVEKEVKGSYTMYRLEL